MIKNRITLLQAFTPIIILILLLAYNVYIYGDNTLGGANQLALIIAAGVAVVIGISKKISIAKLLKGIEENLSSTNSSIVILFLIGALSGVWMISGIVPAMVYYGLQIINPKIFLVTCLIISALVSLATGSSWSTIATIGVALLGIGNALGISEGMVAGAVISGAYFGDKISPLSDTTNLAPAMAGTDLVSHINYMFYTTIPSIVITIIIFLILGFTYDVNTDLSQINAISDSIKSTFNINPFLFVVPAVMVIMTRKKVPAIPSLFVGTILGGLCAVIFQPDVIKQLAGVENLSLQHYYETIVNAMTVETSVKTDNEMLNNLLPTRGMKGMLGTIWLIISAMTFGGVMEKIGALKRINEMILKKATKDASMFTTATGTCLFLNVTTSDQYLSIVLTGKMYAESFKEKGLDPKNLSRTLEDAGTVTSVLIPWNTCGATQTSVLGVSTVTYLPFAIFNYLSPIMTVLFGVLGIKIAKLKKYKKNN